MPRLPTARKLFIALALFTTIMVTISLSAYNLYRGRRVPGNTSHGRRVVLVADSPAASGPSATSGTRTTAEEDHPLGAQQPLTGAPGHQRGAVSSGATPDVTPAAVSQPWCSGKAAEGNRKKPYFLTAAVMVRIYKKDANNLTTSELLQWLQYMSYAGVEHVYVYDNYVYKKESQREALRCFILSGFVTYVDWHRRAVNFARRDKFAQMPAYRNSMAHYGRQFVWQTNVDIDEYPFCPSDLAAGFLARYVRSAQDVRQQGGRRVGQIFMENTAYLGPPPPNVSAHPLLADRFWHRTRNVTNTNRKPIYLSRGVLYIKHVHFFSLRKNYADYSPGMDAVRINHYQGARYHLGLSRFVNLTGLVMVEDRGMSTAVSVLELCRTNCPMGCC